MAVAAGVGRGLAVTWCPAMVMVTSRRGRRVWTSFLMVTPVRSCR